MSRKPTSKRSEPDERENQNEILLLVMEMRKEYKLDKEEFKNDIHQNHKALIERINQTREEINDLKNKNWEGTIKIENLNRKILILEEREDCKEKQAKINNIILKGMCFNESNILEETNKTYTYQI